MNHIVSQRELESCRAAQAQYPQIQGAMIGLREEGRRQQNQLVMRFLVKRKIALEELAPEDVLPKEYDGMPVQVIESDPKLGPQNTNVGRTQVMVDPVVPGVSCGSRGATGTLGCFVMKADKPHLLTNWHVCRAVGEPVYQPGPAYEANPRQIAVSRATTIQSMDVCLAEVLPGVLWNNMAMAQQVQFKEPKAPVIGEKVWKVGATTGLTEGQIVAVGFIRIKYPDHGWANIYAAEVRPLEEGNPNDIEVSEGGDSGAAWAAPDGTLKLLHFAGEFGTDPREERGYGCPLDNIFLTFKLSVAKAPAAAGDPAVLNAVRQNLVDMKNQASFLRSHATSLESQLINTINMME